MNLRWNSVQRRFEAEFSSDFNGDLAAVKAAGFKTDGAPLWTWHTSKAGPLTKLRTLRPGLLTISPEARAQYTPMAAMEEKNAEIKAEARKHDKVRKKKQKVVEQVEYAFDIPEKGYLDVEDLPPMPPFVHTFVPPPPPDTKCIICGAPVYFYEKQDPLTCLYCEKIVLDIVDEVC